MLKTRLNHVIIFTAGMLTFALAAWIVWALFLVERPEKQGIIEDWDQICVWQDQTGIYFSISPQGCFSTNCTIAGLQTSSAVVDLQNRVIEIDARFVLTKISGSLLHCMRNCTGGNIQFKLDGLIPNDYHLRFREEQVGELKIFSGRQTPHQCFEKDLGPQPSVEAASAMKGDQNGSKKSTHN